MNDRNADDLWGILEEPFVLAKLGMTSDDHAVVLLRPLVLFLVMCGFPDDARQIGHVLPWQATTTGCIHLDVDRCIYLSYTVHLQPGCVFVCQGELIPPPSEFYEWKKRG